MAGREMKTIGMAVEMVFADGQRVEYPRYRISANGFIRGPRNEQIGRGNHHIGAASESCRSVQQQWMDQFNRFKVGFQGTSVPSALFPTYDQQLRSAKPFSPDGMHQVIKAYWRDEPDCYDVISVRLTKNWSGTAEAILTVLHMPLRKLPFEDAPSPFDEYGTITQKYVPVDSMITWTRKESANLRAAGGRIRDWQDELDTILAENYVNYVASQPIDEVRAAIDEWLAGTSVVAEITPHLNEIARLFASIGYIVESNGSDTEVHFSVTDNEHQVVFTANSLEVRCLYERDEERLANLQRMRLEEEYKKSLEIHGDLTSLSFTEAE